MAPRTMRVRSTGAEKTPAEPVTVTAAVGRPESTGAETLDPRPATTRMPHLDEPVTVQVATPGPVTVTVGWLADEHNSARAQTKVIESHEQDEPAPATVRASTKRTTGTRAGTRRGRAGDD